MFELYLYNQGVNEISINATTQQWGKIGKKNKESEGVRLC